MIIIYRIIINLVFLFSPIIILLRLIKGKEDFTRFKEKLGFFSGRKKKAKLVWFHGASVGELQSIVPVLEKLNKKKEIHQILLTSNTLSSSKVIQKLNIKKITHRFFPMDTNFLTRKFINYWKPTTVFFIDSEIWPNMIENLIKQKISINLLNGRITKKTYKKWMIFPSLSKKIFSKFNLCLTSSMESKKYLKNLGARNVKLFGNLKFSQSENEEVFLKKKLKKFISSKKVWCASSTHESEEKICGEAHKELKKKYKNLLTIIIPRHVDRATKIEEELNKLNLRIHTHTPDKKINNQTDIYIVNTYGKTKSFYNICKNVFLGGSLINHGGQNPLEAARYGCNILHGPNTSNFKEIYQFLKKNNISIKVKDKNQIINYLNKLFSKKTNSYKIKKKLNLKGQKILMLTYKEIQKLI
tara:strand:+ start:1225 stop:2466 length:1242 start_codon:yes stop_codon:yes gene_type:complete